MTETATATIIVEYELGFRELEEAFAILMRRQEREKNAKSRGVRRILGPRGASIFWVALTAISGLVWYFASDSTGERSFFTLASAMQYSPTTYLAVILFVLYWQQQKFFTPRMRARSAMLSSPEILKPTRLEIGEAKCIYSRPLYRLELEWGYYSRWEQAEYSIILYGPNWFPTTIPLRAFKSKAELDRFRELCNQKLGAVRGAFPVLPATAAQ